MRYLQSRDDSWGEEALPVQKHKKSKSGPLDAIGEENHRSVSEAKPYDFDKNDLDNSRADTNVAIDILLSNDDELLKSSLIGGERLQVLESKDLSVGVGSLANFNGILSSGSSLDLDRAEVSTKGEKLDFFLYKDKFRAGEFGVNAIIDNHLDEGGVKLFTGDKRFDTQLVAKTNSIGGELETWAKGNGFKCYLIGEKYIIDITSTVQNERSWEMGLPVKKGEVVFSASKDLMDALEGIHNMPRLPLHEGENQESRFAKNLQEIVLECINEDGSINWNRLHNTIVFWCKKNKNSGDTPKICCYLAAQIK